MSSGGSCVKSGGVPNGIIKPDQKHAPSAVAKANDLEETRMEVELKRTLWVSLKDWETLTDSWKSQPFDSLSTDEVNTQITAYLKTVYNLDKGLPPNEVVPKLKAMVDEYRGMYSTVVDLRNPALKQRHWEKIQDALGKALVKDETFTLGKLVELRVFDFKEEIGNISSQAGSEAALEEMLAKVVKTWNEAEFLVIGYRDSKDVFILGSIDDIQTLLEDSQVTIATIKGSRFIGPIKAEIERWDKQLSLFADTLDAWLTCQRNWLYLESIFSAPDIQRQLPDEARMFSQNNSLLDQIQKCLEDYLESKRLLFPRFYFLSNEELLEILSQTRNPHAVQPHLSKCFDAIKTLEFSSADPKSIDIIAMMSPEGERVPFAKTIKARGNVEGWLGSVEEAMVAVLRRLLKGALAEYDDRNRSEWLREHVGQVVVAGNQIIWCRDVSEAIKSVDPNKALIALRQKCINNLAGTASLVRGELTKIQRAILGAVITIDVHNRDIVQGLVNSKVTGLADFEWIKQLRYYWDMDSDTCNVKMSSTVFSYGYEYLGCSPRLVITPLTDRCYLTLTGAMQLNLGGSPLGPAGTGKTETVKDLAKAMARQCVVFNCSDGLDYKMMGKMFAGLAQSGAWCCFDEFNRIDIEVLSDMKATKFIFEGREIRLIETCAAFITMNPGYAGRTELPDNLKALFRPIAMMIPDYGLIAEIMLFSEGFENAKILAGKVVNLYKLCSEQVSQQDHYDFGMRAVKSVLIMAGSLKRANPDLSEDVFSSDRFRDSNLPKFLAEDKDFEVLSNTLQEIMREKNLEIVPTFTTRVCQLSVNENKREASLVSGLQKIKTWVLNPKCVAMTELYGEFNLSTMEWKDGLIGFIFRAQVSDNSPDEKWTVCDGPVDALWIENMNTVLDDNKLLTLINGERIKMSNTMHMLFEVADLAVASPATVSRCGMVYMDPASLGWLPYVKSWLKKLPAYVPYEARELLLGLFEKYVEKGLAVVRRSCREYIPSTNINLVISLCKLITTFINKTNEIDFSMDYSDLRALLSHIFVFCYTWSLGGNIADGVQDFFDSFIRDIFETQPLADVQLPSSNNIFCYYVDLKHRTFALWDDLVPAFNYSPEVPYFQMIVPTAETLKYSFLMEALLVSGYKTLFTGNTGVGKSIIVQDLLNRCSKQNGYIPITLNFSAQTNSLQTQQIIELKLEKKRKNILGPPSGFNKLFWKVIQDVEIVACCAPPGGGRNNITPRFLRHFNMFNIPVPTFPMEIKSIGEAIVNSAIEIYRCMFTELLPTPAKSHYTFNLRDLSKASRVFYDRLIDEPDRIYFNKLLSELTEKNLGVLITKDSFTQKPILFGDFGKRGVPVEERQYVEFSDPKTLGSLLEEYLEEYNVTLSKDVRLIFFLDAQQHITRISRIIRQPRGNALLVGVGGTGKQALTRLACHISDFQCISIELTRTYGETEWREDIKRLYHSAGVEGKNTVFLISDTQIKTETFLEDINNILNSGEVPNLFEFDEREKILGEIRPIAREKGIPEDRDSVYQLFINRVRDNLHIVFATSPVGDTFRTRCRMFPSLVNCCTIDWFDEWPRDALLSVSQRFFEFVDLGGPEMRDKISEMCVEIHTSVGAVAKRFYAELRRRYYTTPTSYLELINLYIAMLQEKRKELGSARDRLRNGLNKLAETNDLVSAMQVELEQLGPELKTKAADVEILMVKIAKDQEMADGVRKVVSEEEAVVREQAKATEAIASEAQRDLDEALPALQAAYKALETLDKKDIAELKVFTKPPDLSSRIGTQQEILSDPQFMRKMTEYDKDNIPESITKKLRKYAENPSFNQEAVEKVSKACKSMVMWVIAMDIYSRVFKEVQPKKKRLEEAQSSLELTRSKLAEKTAALQEVENQLDKLKQKYETSIKSKKTLAEKMEETTRRLSRASQLTLALADEQIRWTESIDGMNNRMEALVGNIFLCAAAVAYFGAFTTNYRVELVYLWIRKCQDIGVPVSENFNLIENLADPAIVRDWNIQGLPSDALSTENGILVTRGRRWPLMIDPQGQANKWIRNMEGPDLRIVKLQNQNSCDVGETLDPALEPLLLKQTIRQGGRLLMKLGDSLVEYDRNFKLYITTKLSNPHYLPEVCIKVTIINFTVTKIGLEGQLLADVVKLEKPELEEQRNSLILLFNSEGNILDDEELIQTLNQSKVTSAAIKERVSQAETTEKEINIVRERYRPVAIRGSVLYFVIADLAEIDPMYQFSLNYFKHQFNQCIIESEKADELERRIAILCTTSTFSIFANVSRVEKIATDIPPRPNVPWLTPFMWQNVVDLSRHHPKFAYLLEHIMNQSTEWEDYVEADDPYLKHIPGSMSSKLTDFQRLILVKVIREEKLVASVLEFVRRNLGEEYIDIPPLDLAKVYKDTSNKTPLIFILSTGSDPISALIKFAGGKDINMVDRLHSIFLGTRPRPIAEDIMRRATVKGDWVFLQIVNLAASWMHRLETLVFPAAVLQDGAKVTNEPPKGLRANLARSFADVSRDLFDDSPPQGVKFRKLLFGVCFFNAIIHERKKFGPLGWNITYDWSNSDLEVSISILKNLLRESKIIGWDALLYLTGEITFGGRVTDDWDRRTLRSLLARYLHSSDFGRHLQTVALGQPSVFGMHENANISYQLQESRRVVKTVLDVQPRLISGAGTASSEEIVPAQWSSAAYPSLKPLGGWVKDFHLRIEELSNWVEKGQPSSFWLPGFFFPQGFLTGVLQNHARKYNIPIDSLVFAFKVSDFEEGDPRINSETYTIEAQLGGILGDVTGGQSQYDDTMVTYPEEDGVLIRGLFMEGARWDRSKKCLQDSYPMEMYSTMPLIRFIPTQIPQTDPSLYVCPLYKTSARAGTLSTTGHSTNFVITLNIPSDKPQDFWISKGVALICQLNE
ncbi:hypothetical protein BC829DRAFT_441991 [Chytridium lagenaria]|nr:hypothetical protein BC829DRAFT_441991 [Chytridium lagenaria]